ncbi:MAG: tRNA lysidine(34) synthetase TilS [Mobilicoccus sp.]|nr:tRNA lysidine(34) synthetase TilS [Mobilicoccus sp.]
MPGPPPAVAATRHAVRQVLDTLEPGARVIVGVSGGADSLALAAALAFETDIARPRGCPVDVVAVVVDHGLQDSSAQVAQRAADTCRSLGLLAEVAPVTVAPTGDGGPEARARTARHDALEEARRRHEAQLIVLGHTRDDQAEQVLLGLARGSGTRTLAGMSSRRDALARPFLHLERATTRAACEAQGLRAWEDPHNDDPRFTRVRVRRALAELETDLRGLSAALARSADLLRDDAEALDLLAGDLFTALGPLPWDLAAIRDLAQRPPAVRRRVWRLAALHHGVPGASLRSEHLLALDALGAQWRGQGAVDLPGGLRMRRDADTVHLTRATHPHEGVDVG